NSEVKRRSADGSVGSPHARVGNCQASNSEEAPERKFGAFLRLYINNIPPEIRKHQTSNLPIR
ncbi:MULTISPECIES: hypothetical protein, partial [unclassified Enterobacter]|uniref:hypothetical protein n=1 Tax=unclassified Enterobacter TaxID=2608935 RepID=UPI001C54A98D